MQNEVNAQNVLNSVVLNFGNDNVQTCDGGIIKLTIKELRNGDILTISNLLISSDVRIKRWGNGLIVIFIPKADNGKYPENILYHISQIDLQENQPVESEILTREQHFKKAALPLMNFLVGFDDNTYATVDHKVAMLIESKDVVSRD